jgi:hypothetical protein
MICKYVGDTRAYATCPSYKFLNSKPSNKLFSPTTYAVTRSSSRSHAAVKFQITCTARTNYNRKYGENYILSARPRGLETTWRAWLSQKNNQPNSIIYAQNQKPLQPLRFDSNIQCTIWIVNIRESSNNFPIWHSITPPTFSHMHPH